MKKAFIGPIGDDLPAILPLLVGLLLFFASFKTSYDNFEAKNREIDSLRAGLEIASELEGNGAVTTGEFSERCELAGLLAIDYGARFQARVLHGQNVLMECVFPTDMNVSGELATRSRITSIVFPITVRSERRGAGFYQDRLTNTSFEMLEVKTWGLV